MHVTEGSPTEADQQLNQIYPGIAKHLQVHKLSHTFNKNGKLWLVLRLLAGSQQGAHSKSANYFIFSLHIHRFLIFSFKFS